MRYSIHETILKVDGANCDKEAAYAFTKAIATANTVLVNFLRSRQETLDHYQTTLLTFTDFLGSLFVSFYGWIFFHEVITWHYGISAVCVFIGLYLFYYDELLKQKKKMLESQNS